MSELRFDGVTVRYGGKRHASAAVDDVSLVVPDGEIVGLVGESGSGKSTLGRAAVGMTRPSRGRILLDGKPVPSRGRNRPVQMIFQDPSSCLDPRMTIASSIRETIPRQDKKTGAPFDRAKEVWRLLDLVQLDPELAAAYPSQLSGGQRQRVGLARALGARPDVIIADEITSALDVSVQGMVLNLIRDLQRELSLSMLFISHNLAVVRYVASSIAVMHRGHIVEHGPTHNVLTNPQQPYTQELLAAIPDSIHPTRSAS